MTARYHLDKGNAKLLGVCSGFARWTGLNPTLVRASLVLLTLLVLGPVAIVAYLLIGWIVD